MLRLLPSPVRERDGEEMAATFAAMWEGTAGVLDRVRCVATSFGRLPLVAAAEWWDHLRAMRRARRHRWGGGVDMDAMRRAIVVGARGLLRVRAFTWSAILLLGLGVGAVTTVFTVVDHLFLRPLPYPHAERLFRVQNGGHSFPSLRDFETMPSVEAWAASRTEDVNLTGESEPVRLRQARVTEGFLEFFAARPALGRLLLPEDYTASDVVVLSHAAWAEIWGGDPGVVGRRIRIDGAPAVVVGVVSASFVPPEVMLDGARVDLWRPVDLSHPYIESRGWTTLAVAGRLAPGATLEDASRDARIVAERRAREHPERYVRQGSIVELPIVDLREATVGRTREGLGLLLGAVFLFLLVACVNVAHLFMARGLGRARELAVRRALGARSRTLAGQLLVESLMVGLGGAAVGACLAWWGLGAFLLLSPDSVPRAESVSVDGRVLLFAVALSMATSIVFGLLPMLRVGSRDPGEALRPGGRGTTGSRRLHSLRAGLVVAEVALSLVLVASAGLLLRSFARLHDEALGFRLENVWTAPLRLGSEEDAERWTQRMSEITEAVARLPGARSVTYAMSVPLEHTGGERCCWSEQARIEGFEGGPEAMIHPFGGNYLDVFEPRMVAGRGWTEDEVETVPAPALINESLAVELFGSVSGALGRELVVSSTTHRVVGVLADDRHYGQDQEHVRAVYVPMETVPFVPDDAHLAVRANAAVPELPRLLREAIWSVEPDLPVPLVRSMEGWAQMATARTRFDAWLFASFGAVALLLAGGGVYGTLLYTVGARRRELAIRLALGARRRGVEAEVVGRGVRTAAFGAALGVGAAWGAGRLLGNRLFQVEPNDPLTLACATTVLLLVAAVASWIPAHRAASTDPLDALRQE
jgi:predicted permease